jgi:metal-sulfur cluster biosynthetic enzyme
MVDMATVDQVREALKVVTDPEIGVNIVDLGLVYDVAVDEQGGASVTYTLTSMGCPVGPLFEKEIREAVEGLEGVTSVDTKMVMQPPWGPDKMSEFAKSALGFF